MDGAWLGEAPAQEQLFGVWDILTEMRESHRYVGPRGLEGSLGGFID